MILWKVTWTVLVFSSCPPQPPDPYGREIREIPAIVCQRDERHAKFFSEKKDAEKFIRNAPSDSALWDFKLEEVKP